jgi:regulator of protease activity HflC (stomatin/prohibitin superfamily)
MFAAILIGFFVLIALVGLAVAIFGKDKVGDRYESRTYYRRSGWITFGVAIVLAILVGAISMIKIVGPTEVGVPVSFGSVGDPIKSGVNVTAPWVDIETYPTRPVTVELSGDQVILARTADAGQMSVEVAVRWKVNPENAKELFMQVRTGDDDRISQDIVAKNLRQAVGQVYSTTANLDAMNDRTKATVAIKEQLQEQLDAYGIQVEDVNLRSVEPDAATAATISKFSSQQQATRIAEEAKKTAQIEAQRRLIEAQGLEQAANAVTDIDSDSAKVLCMQIWQQVVSKGIEQGVSVYTNPCGAAGDVSVITPQPTQ